MTGQEVSKRAWAYAATNIFTTHEGTAYRGFMSGYELAEQELEPTVTELGMENIKLKQKVEELEKQLETAHLRLLNDYL